MNAYNTLFPTHNTIALALDAAAKSEPLPGCRVQLAEPPESVPSVSSVPSGPADSAEPNILKYILFLTVDGHLLPIVFPRRVQHNQVLISGLRPIRAGHCMLIGDHVSVIGGGSLTLNLPNRPEDDADILQKALFALVLLFACLLTGCQSTERAPIPANQSTRGPIHPVAADVSRLTSKPEAPANFAVEELTTTTQTGINLMPIDVQSSHPIGTNQIKTPRAGNLTWDTPLNAQQYITNSDGETLILSYAISCTTNHAGLDLGPGGVAKTAIGPARWFIYGVTTSTNMPVTCTNQEAYFQITTFYALTH